MSVVPNKPGGLAGEIPADLNDRFARLLRRVPGMNMWWFTGAVFSWILVVNLIIPIGIMAIKQDYYHDDGWWWFTQHLWWTGAIFVNLIIFPTIAAFYYWMTDVPKVLFSELDSNPVVEMGDEDRRYAGARFGEMFSWPMDLAGIGLSLGVLGIWYGTAFGFDWVRFGNPEIVSGRSLELMQLLVKEKSVDLGMMFALPSFVLVLYMLAMIIFRGGGIAWALRILFARAEVSLEPAHADRSGGLGSIGRYATRFGLFATGVGIGIASIAFGSASGGSIEEDAWIYAMAILYLLLAPAYFFLALEPAHRQMVRSKNLYLGGYNTELKRTVGGIVGRQEGPEEDSTGHAPIPPVQKPKNLDWAGAKISGSPVWPFNFPGLQMQRIWVGFAAISVIAGLIANVLEIKVNL